MQKSDLIFILKSFLVWRIGLFIILYFAIKFIPLQPNFLGGGINNYLNNPYLWSWANFDGENYLSIAKYSYLFVGQAFFPLYPLLIRFLGGNVLVGLIISNSSFLLALIGFYKLIQLDYSEKIAKVSILLLLLFPTSFYFGSVYTESLFLVLVIWSFYFARRGQWLFASFLGAFASGTRIIGIILLPILLIEALTKDKKLSIKHWPLVLIPIGLLIYMYYLQQNYGDSLAFLHSLSSFGEQRSATPILLPQVFYRYIVKIIPNINFAYFPNAFTTLLEFGISAIFLMLSVISFFKLKLSYAIFLFLGYIIPTLSGSFSSMPRYVIVLFPAFILFAIWVNKRSVYSKLLIYSLLSIGLVISTVLFVRGYWIS